MATYILGYTLIALVVAFVVFVELVYHHVIFKRNSKIQSIFAHPLLIYSLRRIGSALISILLAITATFFLIRFKVEANGGIEFCRKVISNWDKMNDAIRQAQCISMKANLG